MTDGNADNDRMAYQPKAAGRINDAQKLEDVMKAGNLTPYEILDIIFSFMRDENGNMTKSYVIRIIDMML